MQQAAAGASVSEQCAALAELYTYNKAARALLIKRGAKIPGGNLRENKKAPSLCLAALLRLAAECCRIFTYILQQSHAFLLSPSQK